MIVYIVAAIIQSENVVDFLSYNLVNQLKRNSNYPGNLLRTEVNPSSQKGHQMSDQPATHSK